MSGATTARHLVVVVVLMAASASASSWRTSNRFEQNEQPEAAGQLHPNEVLPTKEHHRTSGRNHSPPTDREQTLYQKQQQQQQCGCHVITGPPGSPGIPGVPGMHGLRGLDGQKGERGETGSIGLHGQPGPVGPAGERGKKGIDGERGPRGDSGSKGDKGDRGFSGFAGMKGQKGEPCVPTEISTTAAPVRHEDHPQSHPPVSTAAPVHRVAFSVARSQKLGPVATDTAVSFDVINANVGGSFDRATSQFVCRVNGTYQFSGHVVGQNGRDAVAWLMWNDRHRSPMHADGRAGHGTGSQTLVLRLRLNDRVWMQLTKDSALLNDYTTFSGHLLFEDNDDDDDVIGQVDDNDDVDYAEKYAEKRSVDAVNEKTKI